MFGGIGPVDMLVSMCFILLVLLIVVALLSRNKNGKSGWLVWGLLIFFIGIPVVFLLIRTIWYTLHGGPGYLMGMLHSNFHSPFYFESAPAYIGLVILLSRVGAFLLAFVLGCELYKKWTTHDLTDAEKDPGLEGVKAWLSTKNVSLSAGFALCSWIGYGASFIEYFVLSLLVVCAYPIVQMLSVRKAPASPRQDLSEARNKILDLLSEGKITLEESKELLMALADKDEEPAPQSPPPPSSESAPKASQPSPETPPKAPITNF